MALPLKTVAIADDEPGIVAVLKTTVEDMGYRVVGTAFNGKDAVDLITRTNPNVVLLDVHMPILDGLEATGQISKLGTTAVVLLTADVDPEIARKAMDLGASGYMQKPFDSTQIAAILESAWHRFQTVNALQEKNRLLDEALEMRKLTEKAKGILMEQQGFSETEAHKCLLKMSQDQGIPLKEVCRSILQVRMILGKKASRKIA
jgi:two-component system, response regulator PdtaR